jgi:hypothetical protein
LVGRDPKNANKDEADTNDGKVVASSAVKKLLKVEGGKAFGHAAVVRNCRHTKN